MAYNKWKREQYLKLDELVQRKASPGEMAVKMKVDKKDLAYRLHLLKTQTNIQTWTEEELKLLETAKTIDEYVQGCVDLHGKHRDRNIFIGHWKDREKYLAAWFKEKNERKKVHDLAMSQKQIVEPMKEGKKPDTLPDIGEQMATLIFKVSENTAVLKEILSFQLAISKGMDQEVRMACTSSELLTEILNINSSTYALFKSKLEQPKKENGSLQA